MAVERKTLGGSRSRESVYVEEPRGLAPGCLASGLIPRRTVFERGVSEACYREDDELPPDALYDGQAVVIYVEGKGLVVVVRCPALGPHQHHCPSIEDHWHPGGVGGHWRL